MPYVLNQANDVMEIAECEWGLAQTIRFTTFTSCIGVLAKVRGQDRAIGIHLVLVNDQGAPFTAADVPRVTQVLTGHHYDRTTVKIIGQIAVWRESARDAYTALIADLNNPETYPLADGRYGATAKDGEIELTYE